VPEPGKQLNVNALNFSDMGYDITGPTLTSSSQVHANGEIWSATNFRLRQLLVDKYDDNYPVDDQQLQTECAEGVTPAHRCPGNRRWIQLVFDAMLMMPINATMLQARDAALAADLARFGGANQRELWLGYGRSGMGVNATSTNSSLEETDTDPVPDFVALGTRSATVRFSAEDRIGNPVSARFYVGHYEARVSPIADTNPATTPRSSHPGRLSSWRTRLAMGTCGSASASGPVRTSGSRWNSHGTGRRRAPGQRHQATSGPASQHPPERRRRT
jgi:hypothetical protein